MKKSTVGYAPNRRRYFEQRPKQIKTYSARDYTLLPDVVKDPIVASNISNVEFDYTYDRGESL